MASVAGAAAITAGGKILEGLFQSDPEPAKLPAWYIEELFAALDESREGGFVPDESAFNQNLRPNRRSFDQATNAQIQNALAQIPAGEEAFNTQVASRGIYGAGEAPKELYGSVYAPIARNVAEISSQNNLAFERLDLQGRGQMAQNRISYQNLLRQTNLDREQIRTAILTLMRNPGQGNVGDPNRGNRGSSLYEQYRGYGQFRPIGGGF